MTGRIKTLNTEKGFGFVRADNGIEHFFHRTGCLTRFDTLEQGDTVSFDPEESPKGPRATNIEYSRSK